MAPVRYILLCLCMLFCGMLQAQDTRGLAITPDNTTQKQGKTYALIVGISRYQYPDCYPTLHYADADARAFYDYMVANTGGGIDPAHIDTLFNEGATQQDFWKKFNSIKNRLEKDDNFYIYFSGHGDAISSDLAFLLTYNAPPGNDRNNYYTTGGVVDIHALKSLIKMITLDKNKPAHVILITDACRSNELPPGKEEGRQQFYDEMYTKNAGEIQLVSCMANQVSFEDAKWGGGRGLFSWHLINGLWGMADNKPEDGVVTLKELFNYVTDKVQDGSYDPGTKKYRQTPDYCCRDKDDVVMAHVDKPTKDRLAAELQKGSTIKTEGTAYAVAKGVNLGQEMKNEGYEELYKKYMAAINDNRLIEPADDNAMQYLQQILAANIKPELKSDLKFELSSRLMNDVTKVINNYLHSANNNNDYTFAYFNTAIRKLKAFQSIADTLYYNQVDVRANLLFLEGHSKWQSKKSYELRECLAKADSAVALKPNAAYLYYLKGLIHIQLKQYKEAFIYDRKALELAPGWSYPYNDIGNLYNYTGRPDSALIYLFKGSAIDPKDQTFDLNIAWVFDGMGKTDSALYYYRRGLTKDPTDFNIWSSLGFIYYRQKNYDSALSCFHKAIFFNNKHMYSYEGALMTHLDKGANQDSVSYYVNAMIQSDPTSPDTYNQLAFILSRYGLDSAALKKYEQSIALDSMNTDTWIGIAGCLGNMKQYELQAKCYMAAIRIDTTAGNVDEIYNQLGISYIRMDMNDKALNAFANAIRLNPQHAEYFDNYAFACTQLKDMATAEKYYRMAIAVKPDYADANYELAKILARKSKIDEALKLLETAIQSGNYSRSDLEGESAFSSIKDMVRFKELLSKLK